MNQNDAQNYNFIEYCDYLISHENSTPLLFASGKSLAHFGRAAKLMKLALQCYSRPEFTEIAEPLAHLVDAVERDFLGVPKENG
jgi:hypothetical protein